MMSAGAMIKAYAGRKWFGLLIPRSLAALVILLAFVGCAVRPGRDYGHLLFRPSPFFRVQVLRTSAAQSGVEEIGDLLLLPPIGVFPDDIAREFPVLLWQELQQILAGVVRMPRAGGVYVQYAGGNNLVSDHGGVNLEELGRIGMFAGASHVLLPIIVDYRPYHPQRITMEWLLMQVSRQSVVLTVVGTLDASEQRVLLAADSYLRSRKATPYDTGSLDMLLRSPRAFTGFVMHEVVSSLQGSVGPGQAWRFKEWDQLAELASSE